MTKQSEGNPRDYPALDEITMKIGKLKAKAKGKFAIALVILALFLFACVVLVNNPALFALEQ